MGEPRDECGPATTLTDQVVLIHRHQRRQVRRLPGQAKNHAKSGLPTHTDLAIGETRTPHRYGRPNCSNYPFEEHVTPNTSK